MCDPTMKRPTGCGVDFKSLGDLPVESLRHFLLEDLSFGIIVTW